MRTVGEWDKAPRSSSKRGSGTASPSCCRNERLTCRSFEKIWDQEVPACWKLCRSTRASARSRTDCAVALKSSFSGSSTARYTDGFMNCKRELLSIIRFKEDELLSTGKSRSAFRSSGIPSARYPCFVRSQKERRAPAARKRALSVPLNGSDSQSNTLECSSGAQPQCSPFCAQTPCPYCVIFPATN